MGVWASSSRIEANYLRQHHRILWVDKVLWRQRGYSTINLPSIPSVRSAHGNHGGKDVVPRLLIHHHAIGEHAAVPANMLEGAIGLACIILHPITRVAHNIELAARMIRKAMASCFVMRSRSLYGGVVLGDVKIDRPRS